MNPTGDNVESIVNDVLEEEVLLVVKETIHEITDEHMDKAMAYDESVNLLTELVFEMGPSIVSIVMIQLTQ